MPTHLILIRHGETWHQMQARVFRQLKEIVARHPNQTVALFTHGGPCKAAVLGLPPEQGCRWVTSNASIHFHPLLEKERGGVRIFDGAGTLTLALSISGRWKNMSRRIGGWI